MCGKFFLLLILFFPSFGFSLSEEDRFEINTVIQGLSDSWNTQGCEGFGNAFTEDADFISLFGKHIVGNKEIENLHVKVAKFFLSGSNLQILDTQLREVQPGLVIAIVRWRADGFHNPGPDLSKLTETREGIFTKVFVKIDNRWQITASQNTLIQK